MPQASQIPARYSYRDYLQLPDCSCEIINGELFAMTPAPTVRHQLVLRNVLLLLVERLKGSGCEVISAPCDVLLPGDIKDIGDTSTIVQPDIFVVCDNFKLKEKYCLGAPDLIVEIVSPSRPSMDYVKKLHIYEKYGVREYWIVNYQQQEVMVYKLCGNEYGAPKTHVDGHIEPGIFGDLGLALKDIFA
ncbi:Uma2 family endonuclease [Desulfallas thermosapovorans]|uniref:Uma2 family endonuclease n=1 Tax=Desulfallas thermosapovorans DSM 6562 TaxID=1121431 RepID=A0A5S4ZV05_9FIRM|nr:Uma2 family endonuclease [Desulfallas thermosapovorans]TYO96854.1 Uma2 family endonuclease [Desulfallas thermosapovorans DSM 6562]